IANLTKIDSITQKNIKDWLKGSYEEQIKEYIQQLVEENPEQAIDAFYTHLSFGTGGLRGIMGIGTNRMNIYTIRESTQGLSNYIRKNKKDNQSIIIGYDTRHNSRLFAEETTKVLAGNGIQVYLSPSVCPTPFISFGCRFMGCSGGIMITASHNHPEYNGYKVYGSDGSQIVSPIDKEIMEEIINVRLSGDIKTVSSLANSYIELIPSYLKDEYIHYISSLQHYPELNRKKGNSLKIAYTSLHGVGITMVPLALSSWGFINQCFIDKQILCDGNFPTIKSPNPEENEALQMGIQTMLEKQADILIATDPDADRLGIVINHHGTAHILNGNQIAVLYLEHICEAIFKKNQFTERGAFIKTLS
ncbi:MAG TPA: phospho-sugar mutase, partial [Ignavibacteriaceae bacterium]